MSSTGKAEIFVSRAIDARTSSIIALSVNYVAHVVASDGSYAQGFANADTVDHLNDSKHYVSLGVWSAPDFRLVLQPLRAAMLMRPRDTPLDILRSLLVSGLSPHAHPSGSLLSSSPTIMAPFGSNINHAQPPCIGVL